MVDLSFVPEFATRSTSLPRAIIGKISDVVLGEQLSDLALDLMGVHAAMLDSQGSPKSIEISISDVVRGVISTIDRQDAALQAIGRKLPAMPGAHWRRPQARVARFEQDDRRCRAEMVAAVRAAIHEETTFLQRVLRRAA